MSQVQAHDQCPSSAPTNCQRITAINDKLACSIDENTPNQHGVHEQQFDIRAVRIVAQGFTWSAKNAPSKLYRHIVIELPASGSASQAWQAPPRRGLGGVDIGRYLDSKADLSHAAKAFKSPCRVSNFGHLIEGAPKRPSSRRWPDHFRLPVARVRHAGSCYTHFNLVPTAGWVSRFCARRPS